MKWKKRLFADSYYARQSELLFWPERLVLGTRKNLFVLTLSYTDGRCSLESCRCLECAKIHVKLELSDRRARACVYVYICILHIAYIRKSDARVGIASSREISGYARPEGGELASERTASNLPCRVTLLSSSAGDASADAVNYIYRSAFRCCGSTYYGAVLCGWLEEKQSGGHSIYDGPL